MNNKRFLNVPLFVVAGVVTLSAGQAFGLSISLPNGDFSSTTLNNNSATETGLDMGWYARESDDGVRVLPAEFDWSSGFTPALGGLLGELTMISIDNTHTRFGQFFTKPAGLTGTGWSLEVDVGAGAGATTPGFTRIDLWAGNLAAVPTGSSVNIGNNNAPADSLVSGGWTTLVSEQGVFGAGDDQAFAIVEDLTSYDVFVIKVRTTRANNQVGTTFDNFEFTNPIPEPSSGILALLGACLFSLRRRA